MGFIRECTYENSHYVLSTGKKNNLRIWNANDFSYEITFGKNKKIIYFYKKIPKLIVLIFRMFERNLH